MAKVEYSLYQDKPTEMEDLQQGDVIENNEEISNIVKQIYPKISDLEYDSFLVITQSCDLARHDGKLCKSKYINLVPIQPMEHIFLPLLYRVYDHYKITGRLYSAKGKSNAIQLIESICNQNAWALGVFFLHSNIDVKIPVDSVALLQLSFSVPSELHYNKVTSARSGRLDVAFQSRLGWLVGNLYSRVATPDFPKTNQREVIDYLMSSDKENKNLPQWINREQLKKLKSSTETNLNNLEEEQINILLADYDPKAPIEKAISYVLDAIKKEIEDVSDTNLQEIRAHLSTNMDFELLFR